MNGVMKLKYKIRITPKNPFVIGGKKLNNEYIKSLDYIPGSVLRAALSREIVMACPYYNEDSHKKYWVEYKNEKECTNCIYKNLCKNFSNIKIQALSPMNSKNYPLTAMRCKEHPEHKAFDTLAEKLIRKMDNKDRVISEIDLGCPECKKRVERCSGLFLEENGIQKDVEVVNFLVTKNAINPYTRTAKEGILYTLDAGSTKVMIGDEERDLYFEGIIESDKDINLELKNMASIYIGAYNTAGFGKFTINDISKYEDDNVEKIKKRISKFNEKIRSKENIYVPITLESDTYINLNIDKDKNLYDITKEEYKKIFEESFKEISKLGHIFYTSFLSDTRRGFDTSKENVRFRNAKKIIKAGGVIVLEIGIENIDYSKLLQLQESGIGENTNHGFGKIKTCDQFHLNTR